MLVFWVWREIVFGVTYVLSVQYTCVVVSVFLLWREIVLWWEIVFKMQTPFDFLWAVSTKKSFWVTLLWSDSRCVYFVRPNTHLIFLFCILLFYRADPQVEVQIRILLKDKYVKSFQNANTSNHTLISWTVRFPEHRFKENFYLSFLIKEEQLASQFVFLVKSKHWVLADIQFILCLGLFLQDYCSRVVNPASPRIMIVSFQYRDLLQPCSHDCFSKISRMFYASRK